MAINVSNIKFSLEQILGDNTQLILLHSKDWFEYKNGKVTTTRLGTQYEVIENGGDFNRFWVKIADEFPAVAEDELKVSKERVFVTFNDAVCTLYVDGTNHIQVSVKATEINID